MKIKVCNTTAVLLAALVTASGLSALCRAQQPRPYRLTLQDAIQKGLEANLNVLAAGSRIDEAEGARARRFSAALLPRVNAQVYANVQNRDLRAFGITLPGAPEVVGPFSNYDFRIYAQQNVVDLASLRSLRASEQNLATGKLDLQDARDLIVRAVAELYLNAESAAARAEASRTRVRDSNTLLKLATDKHDAGTATGVDVLRAKVQLANDQQAQLASENDLKQTLLALARNIGISPGTQLEIADQLAFSPLKQAEPGVLIEAAMSARADLSSLSSQRRGLVQQQAANRARAFPKLSVNGNIGEIGRSIGGVQTTGLIQGQVDFTIFDRDRTGEAQELAARLKRVDDQIADMRRGIDEEIREALLNLESAADQVGVAGKGQSLAERELELAQDRFQTGTANNVEVVTAQDQLARAEENYILAVSRHMDAKFALARASGGTEKNIVELMKAQ